MGFAGRGVTPFITLAMRRGALMQPVERLVTIAALDLFALVPTATVLSGAPRDNTPRAGWGEVWLSRDGSLADSLGLPESEAPWVIVVSPAGGWSRRSTRWSATRRWPGWSPRSRSALRQRCRRRRAPGRRRRADR